MSQETALLVLKVIHRCALAIGVLALLAGPALLILFYEPLWGIIFYVFIGGSVLLWFYGYLQAHAHPKPPPVPKPPPSQSARSRYEARSFD
jgi:hypothetical protein